jgi:hypothetical protein
VELAVVIACSPIRGQELAVRGKFLDPVVAPIGDVDIAGAIQANAPGQIKLPIVLAFRAPFEQKFALFGELLDAVIEVVHHVEILAAVKHHARRAIELTVAATGCPPLTEELACWAKFLDPIFALGADVHTSFTVHSDARRPDELPIPGAVGAEVSAIVTVHRADGDMGIALGRRTAVQNVQHPLRAQRAVNGQAEPSACLGQETYSMRITEADVRAHAVLL